MAWTEITSANVFPRQSELETILDIELPDGTTGDELLDATIAQVVREVWGYLRAAVAKGYLQALGPAGTLPESLVASAAVLIRRSVLGRIPGLESLHGQIREDEVKTAEKFLRDVATGTNRVEEHEAGEPETVSAPRPSIQGKRLNFSRRKQDGI